MRQLTSLGYLLALAATVFWAGNFIVARQFYDDIPPVALAFWRWTVAAVVLAPFAWRGAFLDRALIRRHLPYLSVTAFLGISLFNTLIYIGSHTTQAINLALIATSAPVFVILMSRVIHGEPITPKRIAGVSTALVGVGLLITGGSLELITRIAFAAGDLYMLLAAVVFAAYAMLVKRKPEAMRMTTFTFAIFVMGVVFLVPFYALESIYIGVVRFSLPLSLGVLYVGVFASVLAYLAWNKAITTIGPTRTAMMYYLIPVFSGLFAWVLLGERVTGVHWLSLCLIVVGISVANSRGAASAPRKTV